jgi:cytochrome c-type protein NapB
MNKITTLVTLLMSITATAAPPLSADEQMSADEMGLSKTSVFTVPTPEAPTYPTDLPGTAETLPRAYPSAPPQVPHEVKSLLPITRDNNACLQCHNRPYLIGQKIPQSQPTPIPKSHYKEIDPGQTTGEVSGARFVCTQCHAPQAEVKPLVANTFAEEAK